MAYIAQSDLDEYLSDEVLQQLTDDDRTGSIAPAIASECIAGAEAEINGLISGRYDVPFVTPPDLIVEIAVVLSVERLYLRRGRIPENLEGIISRMHETLSKIAEGKIKLDLGDDETETSDGYGDAQITGNARLFNRSKLSGW